MRHREAGGLAQLLTAPSNCSRVHTAQWPGLAELVAGERSGQAGTEGVRAHRAW